MPVGTIKNQIYHIALPLLGKKCEWKPEGVGTERIIQDVLYRHHAVGAGIQVFRHGALTEHYCVGKAGEGRNVTENTVFRSASIAKTVTALLVFRLQSMGKLDVHEDISAFWKGKIRNPLFPEVPITLAMLMSHTSSICDSPAYFASFEQKQTLSDLLTESGSYLPLRPGSAFRYSNFAAGMIGCLLEHHFQKSIEELAQECLFQPAGIKASYDLSCQSAELLADSYRVMPYALAFSAEKRIREAKPIREPDEERHYLFCSGSVFLTAQALAKLSLLAWNGGGLIDEQSLTMMKTPFAEWPEKQIRIRHGMGLFRIEDQTVSPDFIWGHQGIAYGAVNGLFFDAKGNGFAILTAGASEERKAHLTKLNLELIDLLMGEKHGKNQ